MTKKIEPVRLIYPYYDNPQMLEKQIENWNRLTGELREAVKIIIVDDCSPNHPAEPIFKECKAPKALFRVKDNIRWNQHGARNLGAKVAGGDDMWLYMSDMDIIITPEMLYKLMTKPLSGKYHYTFDRAFAPDFKKRKWHCNTFLVKRSVYWHVGGYDEDYCGAYGGDGPFKRQLNVIAPQKHLEDIVLLGYERDVIADANTTEWGEERKGTPDHLEYRRRFEEKRRSSNEKSQNPIRFDWERIF